LLTKIADFGHFIMLDGMNSVFWRLVNIFSLLAAGFCPKKFCVCPKNYRFARLRGTAAPSDPGSYTYANTGNGHANGNGTAITGNSFITRTT